MFRAVTKSSESCLEQEKQEKNLPNLLLQAKTLGIASSRALNQCESKRNVR